MGIVQFAPSLKPEAGTSRQFSQVVGLDAVVVGMGVVPTFTMPFHHSTPAVGAQEFAYGFEESLAVQSMMVDY